MSKGENMVERVANALREGGSYEDMAAAVIAVMATEVEKLKLGDDGLFGVRNGLWAVHDGALNDALKVIRYGSVYDELRTALSQPNDEGEGK